MNKLRNLAIVGGVILAGTLFGFVRNTVKEKQAEAASYVANNLDSLVSKQEDLLGIKFLRRPKVVFDDGILGGQSFGIYDPKKDEVYLNPLSPNYLETLAHEIGHYYADQLSESLGKGDYPNLKKAQKEGNLIPMKVVAEGMGKYFEIKTTGVNGLGNWDRPTKVEDFVGNDNEYLIGYYLVAPILNRDVKRGIELLITNPPAESDLINSHNYQQRILKMMKRDK